MRRLSFLALRTDSPSPLHLCYISLQFPQIRLRCHAQIRWWELLPHPLCLPLLSRVTGVVAFQQSLMKPSPLNHAYLRLFPAESGCRGLGDEVHTFIHSFLLNKTPVAGILNDNIKLSFIKHCWLMYANFWKIHKSIHQHHKGCSTTGQNSTRVLGQWGTIFFFW